MGIPSYFSHIIKNYPNIIRNLSYFSQKSVAFDELYMDCNSIIYDSAHELEKKGCQSDLFEHELIQLIIVKIEEYIKIIKPRDVVYIAFDGVAPFAKMEQQRTRRYKSQFMAKLEGGEGSVFCSAAITPGTEFMNKLCQSITKHFTLSEKKYNVGKIITSCSDECGEGEHKLFKYIRNTIQSRTIAVYGLDSDLIMLSIFHLKYCSNLFIFREAPEFLKSSIPLDIHSKENEPHFLDIKHLSSCINAEMACKFHEPDMRRTVDYIFLCFLLGNDFLPHFPAMNIRTHGITALLDIYRKIIGNYSGRFLISSSNEIQWKNMKMFISEIAKLEYGYLLNEYFVRDNFDKRTYPETTDKEKEEVLKNVPILYRAEEKYICPNEPYWENRYYKSLFHINKSEVQAVCVNYLEGLEWVFLYYTEDCPDWRWKYNYHYPPLFADLAKYIPDKDSTFIKKNNNRPFTEYAQLSYVLPPNVHYLLPLTISSILKEKYDSSYPETYPFQWAFCRYLWEAHPILPEISIQQLEYIDSITV